jgi:hypothetical protein
MIAERLEKVTILLALAALIMFAGSVTAAQTQPGFEPEPVFRASSIVAAELLKGPHFAVDDRVPVRGLLDRFTIRSDYGTFQAHGIHMLQVRVREVYGLTQLSDMSGTTEFADAAAKAVARPVASAVNMVENPVETVEGLPGGLSRLFDRVEQGTQAVVAAASAPAQSDSEKMSAVTQRVGSITADAFGYEKERRDLAKSVGVDPYTTNPVLAKKLTDMAWVAFSGRFAIQAAMSIFVPGSTVMGAVTITNSTVYDTPPGDLISSAQTTFAATGASDAQVQALIKNPQYSLSVLTALARGVQRLQGTSGLASIVSFATIAKTQDETRMVAGAVNMLARYHETVRPIARVTAPGPILGYTGNGALIVVMPADYVAWTERIGRFAQRADLRAPERIGWISGQFSPRARRELEGRGWTLSESYSVAAER